MRYFWAEIEYEGDLYDVCLDTLGGYVEEEIRAHDSEINLLPVMDENIVRYMVKKANLIRTEPKLHADETMKDELHDDYQWRTA